MACTVNAAGDCQECQQQTHANSCRALCHESTKCRREGKPRGMTKLNFCEAHFQAFPKGWVTYMERHPDKAEFLWTLVFDKIRLVPSVADQWPEGFCNFTTAALLYEIALARKPWKFVWKQGFVPVPGGKNLKHFWLYDADARMNVDLTAAQFPMLFSFSVWAGPDSELPYQTDLAIEPAARKDLTANLLEYLAQTEADTLTRVQLHLREIT